MIAIPPPPIHSRVTGKYMSDEEYTRLSERLVDGLDKLMASQGLEVSQFKSVLDFGCGCGRILAHYVPLAGSIAFCGTDIDEAMIDWCREHIPGMDFSVNGALPPLRWPDGQFDFVLAISVFTHLPWKMQIDWLKEFRRVLRPGGYALATTHGDYCAERFLTGNSLNAYRETGYCYLRNLSDPVFPDWYKSTFINSAYAQRIFGQIFEHVVHVPRGLADFQDAVILRRD